MRSSVVSTGYPFTNTASECGKLITEKWILHWLPPILTKRLAKVDLRMAWAMRHRPKHLLGLLLLLAHVIRHRREAAGISMLIPQPFLWSNIAPRFTSEVSIQLASRTVMGAIPRNRALPMRSAVLARSTPRSSSWASDNWPVRVIALSP